MASIPSAFSQHVNSNQGASPLEQPFSQQVEWDQDEEEDLFVEAPGAKPGPGAVQPPSDTSFEIDTQGLVGLSLGADDNQRDDGARPVTQLQLALQAMGYLPRITSYGYLGTLTVEGLRAFQEDQGLLPTGVLDSSTLVALQDPRPVAEEWALPFDDVLGRPVSDVYDDPETGGQRQDFDQGYALSVDGGLYIRAYDDTDLVEPILPVPTPITPPGAMGWIAPFFSQLNPAWSSVPLGDGYTIGTAGCAATAATMAISAAMLWDDRGTIDPGTLVSTVQAANGFRGASIRWGVAATVTDTEYRGAVYDNDLLNTWLAEPPHAPAVVCFDRTNDGGDAIGTHYLLVVGSGYEEGVPVYYAIDPARPLENGRPVYVPLHLDDSGRLVGVAGYQEDGGAVHYTTSPDTYMHQYLPPDEGAS